MKPGIRYKTSSGDYAVMLYEEQPRVKLAAKRRNGQIMYRNMFVKLFTDKDCTIPKLTPGTGLQACKWISTEHLEQLSRI